METKVKYQLFPYNPEVHIFEVEDNPDFPSEIKELFWSGYFDGAVLYIDKFISDDLSINLEQLEVATMFAVNYLYTVTAFDNPITLNIGGWRQYCELRGISDKPANMKEEYYVIKGIVEAVANNESVKWIEVKYVSDPSDAPSWRQ